MESRRGRSETSDGVDEKERLQNDRLRHLRLRRMLDSIFRHIHDTHIQRVSLQAQVAAGVGGTARLAAQRHQPGRLHRMQFDFDLSRLPVRSSAQASSLGTRLADGIRDVPCNEWRIERHKRPGE